jgi:hypothetical protein
MIKTSIFAICYLPFAIFHFGNMAAGALHGKYARREDLTQRRKGAKKPLETRQRFAPLRLCARNFLGKNTFVQSRARFSMENEKWKTENGK